LAERPNRQSDITDFRRGLVVLAVVALREFQVGQCQFIHGEILSPGVRLVAAWRREPPAIGQPLGNSPMIFGFTLNCAVSTAVNVSTVQAKDALV
jgi:hypothetical protein